jgi:hypothetical protein
MRLFWASSQRDKASSIILTRVDNEWPIFVLLRVVFFPPMGKSKVFENIY